MFKREWLPLAGAGLSAFCVYTCMFAFRKPFTAASYASLRLAGVEYKVWLVIAQTVGYTLSKFYGVRFIAELKSKRRTATLLLLIGIAWTALLFFALTPPPYNIVFLLLNGFPLGIIYGLVFSYLEGRRSTELLGAVLASSFIFASGFTQSVGKYILLHWNVSEWWMPFVTGGIFALPTVLFTLLLKKTPPPTEADKAQRTVRLPMRRQERQKFIRTFLPGLLLLIATYVLLTVIREYRSNFAANIWAELGLQNNAAVFTQTEVPASVVTLVLLGMLVLVKSNFRALMINHAVVAAGFALCLGSTWFYTAGVLSPFWWMTLTGIGLYMGYVPFNAMLFERLIASFQSAANAGFLIYLADSFGYLGSDAVLLARNFWRTGISWSDFFVTLLFCLCALGILLTFGSAAYFRSKHYSHQPKTSGFTYG